MKKFGLLLNLILLLPLGIVAGSCSKDDNVEGKNGSFGVSSSDLVCDYNKTVTCVPYREWRILKVEI